MSLQALQYPLGVFEQPPVVTAQQVSAWIDDARVLDDFGYEVENTDYLLEIGGRINF